MKSVLLAWLAVLVLVVGAQNAKAEDISGPIAFTKVIFEDSQLVGDVVCTMTDSPCIDFGASHIKLRLNGFTMTGPAEPDNVPDPANPSAFCNETSGMPVADGIRIRNQTHAQILRKREKKGTEPFSARLHETDDGGKSGQATTSSSAITAILHFVCPPYQHLTPA